MFQSVFHGGSRGALVRLLPMKPSAKEFQDSVRGEPPNSVRMDLEKVRKAKTLTMGNPLLQETQNWNFTETELSQGGGGRIARTFGRKIIRFKTFPTVDLATPWSICSR